MFFKRYTNLKMKLLFKNKIKLNTHKNFYNLYYFKKEKFLEKRVN